MTRFVFTLFVAATLFANCSPSKKTSSLPAGSSTNNSTVTPEEQDGTSYEKAIIIKEKSELKGVDAEYAWIRKHYPGHKVISQSLSHKDKKSFDIIDIETADGSKKSIYFDITNFFGKL